MNAKRKRNINNAAHQVVQSTMLQLTQPVAPSGPAVHSARSAAPRSRGTNNTNTTNQQPTRSRNQEAVGRTLDGFMLLDCCRVEFPDEVAQAVLSGLRITTVVAEDLFFFSNLTRLDLSDNEAPFEPFGGLPQLQELDLQCNAIQQVTVPSNSFFSLEVLNVSFNCLTARDLEELSKLLRIRELYIGNNWIRSVPPVMDRFSKLETLSLEHNSLSDNDVFNFLAMMPRLRNLNVAHNKLTAFPESALSLDNKRGVGFYQLMYLNLAHNKISHEDGVIFTGELHSLRKVVLYGNPLAHAAVSSYDRTKLQYDPIPTLTEYLLTQPDRDVTVHVSYPDTKKKRHAAGTHDNIEIYKMLSNDVPLPSPFRSRAAMTRAAEEADEKKPVRKEPPRVQQLVVDTSDTTFLTGVGIEDVLTHRGDGLAELPAVPASVIMRSLEVNKQTNPLKARAAINALRYQLQHPLTSHDDSDVFPTSSQRTTQAQIHRQLPRHPLQPERRRSQGPTNGSSTSPRAKAFTTSPSPFRPLDGSRAVDDALTQLSYQVAKTWDKLPPQGGSGGANNPGREVDHAMDSLVSTAQRVTLTFQPLS